MTGNSITPNSPTTDTTSEVGAVRHSRLSIVHGRDTGGKTIELLRVIAGAQRKGQQVVLIDVDQTNSQPDLTRFESVLSEAIQSAGRGRVA